MVGDSRMSLVRDVAIAWIVGRQSELGSITMSLVNVSDSSIVLSIDSRLVQIVIPSSFHIEECGSSFPTSFSDEVFLVTSGGEKSDESFDNMLMMVNEKLERVAIQPDALAQVLDHLLVSFLKYKDRRGGNSAKGGAVSIKGTEDDDMGSDGDVSDNGLYEDDECDEGDDLNEDGNDDYGYDLAAGENVSSRAHDLTAGCLYDMAEAARARCESAREKAGFDNAKSTSSNHNDVLQWCIVSVEPKTLTVCLNIQVGGIVRDENFALALGILPDTLMKFSLVFDESMWTAKHRTQMRPLDNKCIVAQDNPTAWKNPQEQEDPHDRSLNNYGTGVLLPKLVQAFFQYLAYRTLSLQDKPESRELDHDLRKFTSMDNTFIGLLCFICARIRALPDWCVVCWNSLPYSVYRLRTCNKDLCLFTFEELGVGTLVLPELQTCPELVDFELSLALVAARSARDVFEPFPSFLLEKEQLRGRSGFFSKKERVDSDISSGRPVQLGQHNHSEHARNKNLNCLCSILQTYPSVQEMQSCRNEFSLMSTLNRSWMDRQTTLKGKRLEEQGAGCGGAELKCLPHSLLRYILFTSRLKLKLLEGQEKLPFFDTYYQFAVLHDSPEKEASFEGCRRQQKGSFFAFHGSSAANWYSILRNGLRCLSNTNLMSSGASYGSGIYFASHFATSLSYAVFGAPGWRHGLLKEGFSIMAICEIISGSTRTDSLSAGVWRDIMVVPQEHEQNVSIRYILVLKGGRTHGHALITGTKMAGSDLDNLSGTWRSTIDLGEHYQGLRSAYGRQRDEQRSRRWGEHFESISSLSREMREREEIRKREEASIDNRGKAEVEHVSAEASRRIPVNEAQVCMGASSVVLPVNVESAMSLSPVNVKVTTSFARGGGVSTSAMKAILKEYKNIVKQVNEAKVKWLDSRDDDDMPILAGLEVTLPDESNISRWHVHLSQYLFKRFPLYKDLVHCAEQWKVGEVPIKLECMFPDAFPFLPPFVRVISPRFSFHTGHVTVGGSICMELLTESGWSPACSFESLVVQIVNAMIEGGGRVDWRSSLARGEYGEHEALEAFDRVARDHGWIR